MKCFRIKELEELNHDLDKKYQMKSRSEQQMQSDQLNKLKAEHIDEVDQLRFQ